MKNVPDVCAKLNVIKKFVKKNELHSYGQFLINSQMLLTSQLFKLECGPIPNLMVALPNIGGTLCSTPQSLADAHY